MSYDVYVYVWVWEGVLGGVELGLYIPRCLDGGPTYYGWTIRCILSCKRSFLVYYRGGLFPCVLNVVKCGPDKRVTVNTMYLIYIYLQPRCGARLGSCQELIKVPPISKSTSRQSPTACFSAYTTCHLFPPTKHNSSSSVPPFSLKIVA